METIKIEKKERKSFKDTKVGQFIYKYRWPLTIILSSALGVAGDEIVRNRLNKKSDDPAVEDAIDVPFEDVPEN